ncbi:hypothetical protein JL721_4378 [Aureococcus anophagefferens]|nr:hypothetical protein JL721_4378 [Aureococcus anophagefferens]
MSSLSASAEAGGNTKTSNTTTPKTSAPKPADPKKLRLLCLHGYAQNANFFSSRTGAVRKGIKALADVHYLDAPHAATGAFLGDIDADARGAPLGWWNTRDAERPALSGAYVGLDESGATLAALLCLSEPGLFGFALLFAGFVPRDAIVRAPFDAAAAAPNATPTFHCLGASDASVPPDVARSLASCFASPAVFEHAGGHVVPGNAPLRNAVKDFLRARH